MTTEPSISERLAAPFAERDLKFFPVSVTKDRSKGKVGTFADVRVYMDRLNEVLGLGGWQTNYVIRDAATGAVECQLGIKIDGEWVTRCDVGYPNDARDMENAAQEALKSAYSDALKRACVQIGVGRFLYSIELERDWLELDEYGKFKPAPRIKTAGGRVASQPSAKAPERPVEGAQHVSATPAPTHTAPVQQTPAAQAPPASGPCEHELNPEGTACVLCGEVFMAGDVDQMGEFKGESGGVNMTKFIRYFGDQGLKSTDIGKLAPHPSGNKNACDPQAWLVNNPGKTLYDLVKEARERQAADGVTDAVREVRERAAMV